MLPIHSRSLAVAAAVAILSSACAPQRPVASAPSAPPEPGPKAGLLVMAHGGAPEWDQAVGSAVEPLRARLPTALALGMADPVTLQAALDSLEAQGVERVAVVRVFLSGASFLHQTEYLLGLREDAPAHLMVHHQGHHGMAAGGGIDPLRHRMEILLSREGLGEAEVAGRIMERRARDLSDDPGRERVLLLAHGMGEERENAEVLQSMDVPRRGLLESGFKDVKAATLREDWPEARAVSEADIRRWMEEGGEGGDRVLVVPFRLFGFGPYAEVLEGLAYQAGDGLLPHPLVTAWIEAQARLLLCGDGGGVCPLADARD